MNVNGYISALAKYGIDRGLIEECDKTWAINQIIDALGLHAYNEYIIHGGGADCD